MIINNLKSFLYNYICAADAAYLQKKLTTEPFGIFGVLLNDVLVDNVVKESEKRARNSQTATWWLENPEARVVELELVEKRK